jgi:membrane protease YdiL (CAAX protease family)
MSQIQPEPEHSRLAELFFSPGETRLRAGWRLAIQSLILLLLGGCLSIPLFIAVISFDPTLLLSYPGLKPEHLLLAVIAETFAVTLSVLLARRFLDRRSVESLGLKLDEQSLSDLLAGFGIALLQIGSMYLLMAGLGWISFQGFAWQSDPAGIVLKNTVVFFIVFLLAGWNEELLSRGYHLQTLASGINLFWGVIISSALFGILHLGNPGANWLGAAGTFLAGIYLAYGYIRTRQLWLSIGLHIGWNFFEGVVFGFPVSGLDLYTLIRMQVRGPDLATGSAFGPEAGLIILPSLFVGGFLIYLYTRKRKG